MNKGEKRQFKLMAGLKSGEKKYIELFDQIDRQSTYDEAKLLKNGQYGKTLSAAKNYLFRFLLRSLTYADSNPEGELGQYLDQARILTEKDLYSQALKILKKGIRDAKKIEAFSLLHQFLEMKMALLPRIESEKALPEKLEEVFREQQEITEKMVNLDNFNFLLQRANLLLDIQSQARGKQDSLELKALSGHPLMESPSKALSIKARLLSLIIHRKLANFHGNVEKAIAFGLEIIEIYDSNHQLQLSRLASFYNEYMKYCICLIRDQKYSQVRTRMVDFEAYRDRFPGFQLEHFQAYSVLVLGYALKTGDFDKAIALKQEIKEGMVRYQEQIPTPHLLALQYYMAQLHFTTGHYSEALMYINHLLSEPKTIYRQDLQGFARILRLMVYFEAGDLLALDSELRSVERFLGRMNSFHRYEEVILQILKMICFEAGLYPIKSIFSKALVIFNDHLNQEKERGIDALLNFHLWLKSKVENVPMGELIRAQVREFQQ